MANTYVLISSTTLTTSTASVTFNSIPNTYTDLVVKASTRSSGFSGTVLFDLNNDGGISTTNIAVEGNGSTISYSTTTDSYGFLGVNNRSDATSNTFSNTELYIPNYLSTTRKPTSAFGVSENNAASGTGSKIRLDANLSNITSAITTIQILPNSSTFAAGSSFFLYGIKNS